MRKKRQFTTFSLSFLDIMCCGFGAVVLVFLIIDHASQALSDEVNRGLLEEINFLHNDIEKGQSGLVRLRNALSMIDQQLLQAQGLADRVQQQKANYQDRFNRERLRSRSDKEQLQILKNDIKQLEQQLNKIRNENDSGKGLNPRSFLGEGDRQYLTGLKLGGERILILLDRSASMLDERIVNIIRLRNMESEVKRKAKKWQRALDTVKWLVAQLPADSQYQIYSFNDKVAPAVAGSLGNWLDVSNAAQLEDALSALHLIEPDGGNSLENVFLSMLDLSPLPDNVFLLTDGLPTQGARTVTSGKVSGKQRMKLFSSAVEHLPASIPINIILAPMEGDPMAASAFWQLAQSTQGSLLSPAKDWP